MPYAVTITDPSGAVDRGDLGRIAAILAQMGLPAEALQKRAIPRTATGIEPRAKFQLVWIRVGDQQTANALAEKIRQQTGKQVTVSEVAGEA